MDPTHGQYQPRYVSLNPGSMVHPPPPYRRAVPRYESQGSGGNCCLRICCCILVLIISLASLLFFLYAVYKPSVPSYKINQLSVKTLSISNNNLDVEFDITVKADNRNDFLGFTYGKDSSVVVLFSESQICAGKIPGFHQPNKNVTMINIDLKGRSGFGSNLQTALMEGQHEGKIPLKIEVTVPVTVVVVNIPLRKVMVVVHCSLVLDNLAAGKKVGIVSSDYDFRVSLL